MAKLNFFALHDMKQGPMEKVNNFWTKIQVQTEQIKDTMDPARVEMLQWQDFLAADRDDIITERKLGGREVQDFYEKMLFIARLYGEVLLKVMEAAPVLAVDALNAAMAAETLITNQKGNLKLPTKVFAV